MNGELAQVVALVSHGNVFLHDPAAPAPKAISGNSTFRYVESVDFARYEHREQKAGTRVAATVEDWFAFLRAVGTERLWNIGFAWDDKDHPEHRAVAFAGGVPTAIQADLPAGYELWYPRWQAGGPADRPWRVEYRSLRFERSSALPLQDLTTIKLHLQRAIERAEAFARRPEVGAIMWADWFGKAIRLLNDPAPEPPFHSDMLPSRGYGLDARQLLAAATQAYVFGGMGSWNDLTLDGEPLEREYQAVSAELYAAVKLAVVMASNSFAL